MNAQTALTQAIQAAKQQNWTAALDFNQLILDMNTSDLGALNRLGIAHIQLGDLKKAKQCFKKVIELDKSNTVAKKNLAKLDNNQLPSVPAFFSPNFIEEPGKTKTIELHRLASKNVLESLAVGQACELKPKSRYISVEAGKNYIGSLPEDVSFRLSKLIETGNQYECYIQSISSNHCAIFIKESLRAVVNKDVHSFPPNKTTMAAINDVDDRFLLDDETHGDASIEVESDVEKAADDTERLED
ncbi:MAG: tetratricopeptide repeat protein [bacterium]|nr:tetratricopeptide repeat protein [bacterium]